MMKNKLTHTVTQSEIAKAFHVWHSIMNKDRTRPYANPWKFFGLPKGFNPNFTSYHLQVSENTYNKIKLLCSEHPRTLLKAFAARTGYQKEIP